MTRSGVIGSPVQVPSGAIAAPAGAGTRAARAAAARSERGTRRDIATASRIAPQLCVTSRVDAGGIDHPARGGTAVRTLNPGRAGAAIAAALAATVLAGCTVPAPEGQAPAALPRRGLPGGERDDRPHLRAGAGPPGQPGRPQARPLPARGRHGGQAAGVRVGPRRRLLARATRARAPAWRASSRGWATSRSRSTTGCWRPPGCGGHPNPSAECRAAARRGAARRPGGGALAAAQRGDLPHRPRPDRDGRRLRRRDHLAAGRLASRGPGLERQPGVLVGDPRGGLGLGRHARREPRSPPATPPRCSSTARRTARCPTPGR